jgi:drug/metabolite transporter (DMT)-like permease
MTPWRAVTHTLCVHGSQVATCIAFGLSAVLNSFAIETVPPFMFAALRAMGSAIFLTLIAVCFERPISLPQRADFKWLIVLAIFGVAGQQLLYIIGMSLSSANISSALQPAAPVYVAVVSILLRMEKFGVLKVFGVIVCYTSAVLMAVGSLALSFSWWLLLGIVLLLLQLVFTGTFYLVLKKFGESGSEMKPIMTSACCYILGAVMLDGLALPWLTNPSAWTSPPLEAWGALLFLIIFPSSLGYIAIAWGSRHTSSLFISLYSILDPIFTALFGYLIFSSPVGWPVAVGGTGIALGMMLVVVAGVRESAAARSQAPLAAIAEMLATEDDDAEDELLMQEMKSLSSSDILSDFNGSNNNKVPESEFLTEAEAKDAATQNFNTSINVVDTGTVIVADDDDDEEGMLLPPMASQSTSAAYRRTDAL